MRSNGLIARYYHRKPRRSAGLVQHPAKFRRLKNNNDHGHFKSDFQSDGGIRSCIFSLLPTKFQANPIVGLIGKAAGNLPYFLVVLYVTTEILPNSDWFPRLLHNPMQNLMTPATSSSCRHAPCKIWQQKASRIGRSGLPKWSRVVLFFCRFFMKNPFHA